MKKLMFATALAASVAAFADPLNAISFEGYAPGSSVTNAEELTESGTSAGHTYFFYTNTTDGADSSYVTNYESGTTFAAGHRPQWFVDQAGTIEKYLALDTEGGTLWRNINHNDANYASRAIASAGTYLDTLVQFTVTEDEAPETTTGDKLAIWLQADEGTTNLMVRAKTYIADVENATLADAVTNFTIAVPGITIEAGQWYRLTVKAIPNLLNTTDYGSMCGFRIYIDGQPAKNTLGATFNYADFQTYDMITSEMATLMGEGSVFASLGALDDTSLQGVGFKGTGAVDDIVWTEEDPFPASGVEFTLTWDANVTAVSFTIDGTTTTIADLTTYTNVVSVAPNAVVTVAATPAAWYTVSGTGDVTVASAMTQNIVATLAGTPDAAGATGLPSGVTTAAAKTWADAKNLTPTQIATSTYAEKAYLLNTGLDYEPTFEITAIEEVSGGWQITVEAKYNNTEVNLGQINGTLKVKTGATLSDLASATSESATFTVDGTGKATTTITGSGKNFIKATVEPAVVE